MGSVGSARNTPERSSISFGGFDYAKSTYYLFRDGSLYRNVASGLINENRKPYRVAGDFNIYVDSFRNAAFPHSKYYIADKTTGSVFTSEIPQGVMDEKSYMKQLVDFLKNGGK